MVLKEPAKAPPLVMMSMGRLSAVSLVELRVSHGMPYAELAPEEVQECGFICKDRIRLIYFPYQCH